MEEVTRKIVAKRIKSPDGRTFVAIPVVTEIRFRDPKSLAQDYIWRVDNSSDNKARTTHIRHVLSGNNPSDKSNTLDVERIDGFQMRDPKTQAQVSRYRLKNNDPPPSGPNDDDSVIHHKKKHVVRWTSDDKDVWIDSELIDELEMTDAKEGPGQGRIFRINNYLDNDGNKVD